MNHDEDIVCESFSVKIFIYPSWYLSIIYILLYFF